MGGRYRSFSGSLIDPEKQYHSSFDSDRTPSSQVSSRSTSFSHTPMLGQGVRAPKFAYHLPRRRFSRYFTFTLTSTLALFIFYLVHSSRVSHAEVESGVYKPPPGPHAWEQFPFLKRYHGGIRTLVSKSDNVPEYPTDEEGELQKLKDAAAEAQQSGKSGVETRDIPQPWSRFDPMATTSWGEDQHAAIYEPAVKCYLDNKTMQEVPQLLAYNGRTSGFPDPIMGSHDLLGLRNDVCFERYGRLGPYGFGYSRRLGGSGAGLDGEKEGSENVWGEQLEIDYTKVRWAEAQEECVRANAHRFRPVPELSTHQMFSPMHVGSQREHAGVRPTQDTETRTSNGKEFLSRTAVIIRTWWKYKYDAEDLFYLRALINELSIQSGGEYTVHFLVHVQDDNKQIWADEEIYEQVLNASLPQEFRGMGTLWSERQMGLIYGGIAESFYRDLPVHGVYRSTNMPLQYFSHMHPEYDFFWHWEMDVRYTGHFYHLFHQVSQWAKKQPRKGLWERNSLFYIPSEHGSWDDFRHMVRVQTEHGSNNVQNVYSKLAEASSTRPTDEEGPQREKPIWGPRPPTAGGDFTVDPENDPVPPTSYDKDNYEWGVGEEADLITFNPLFDPQGTNWVLAEDTTGYNTSADAPPPPRRAAVVTASRLSRRLLETMHRETALGRHTMFSEMWPASCALHHGLKAVYAPHPVYIDRAWPTAYLAAVFNNDHPGRRAHDELRGRPAARTSVFSDDRQHNFLGTTWYYHTGFSPNLWKRWLGYKVDNDGGEEWELAHEGRMCMPAMLLHPVKQVDLVYEHRTEDDEVKDGGRGGEAMAAIEEGMPRL